ncbi:hypothetical protein JR316_0007565 [Psilocybe cubensis]|uniref:Uncharacterized protein n=1 Tax=Psilocybe cubensis TaxID=181762 RepID=A0ACB8GZK6_PSICU|nr:hypothetical protein JR316_0007565 [Psilocybe cubensis]KAH9480958.1 hypothetical protein JR316_0007565 [Psilocybe cubensis]
MKKYPALKTTKSLVKNGDHWYSSAHQSLTPKIVHSPGTESQSISDAEELKEKDQYANYGKDSDFFSGALSDL